MAGVLVVMHVNSKLVRPHHNRWKARAAQSCMVPREAACVSMHVADLTC